MVDEYAPIDTVVLESIAKRYRTDESVSAVELALGDIDGHQGLTITFDPEHYPDRVGKRPSRRTVVPKRRVQFSSRRDTR
jgi:hypothetical protein